MILRARHDHNKIAPCGISKVFLIELIAQQTKSGSACQTNMWGSPVRSLEQLSQ